MKKRQSSEGDGDFWNTGCVDQPGLEETGTRYRGESGAAGGHQGRDLWNSSPSCYSSKGFPLTHSFYPPVFPHDFCLFTASPVPPLTHSPCRLPFSISPTEGRAPLILPLGSRERGRDWLPSCQAELATWLLFPWVRCAPGRGWTWRWPGGLTWLPGGRCMSCSRKGVCVCVGGGMVFAPSRKPRAGFPAFVVPGELLARGCSLRQKIIFLQKSTGRLPIWKVLVCSREGGGGIVHFAVFKGLMVF